jgi:hypothetical protein
VRDPAQQLASVLIPMPPQPRCLYATEYGHGWMLSHRFVAAVGGEGLVCLDCQEVWPKPRQQEAH